MPHLLFSYCEIEKKSTAQNMWRDILLTYNDLSTISVYHTIDILGAFAFLDTDSSPCCTLVLIFHAALKQRRHVLFFFAALKLLTPPHTGQTKLNCCFLLLLLMHVIHVNPRQALPHFEQKFIVHTPIARKVSIYH